MADLSPNLLKQPKGLALSRLENDLLWHGLVSYSRSSDKNRHFFESMVLASFFPPPLELVHSLGDPLLSRSSVCSSFRPVSEISAHCSHLRGSSHLDSTRTLVPRPLIR